MAIDSASILSPSEVEEMREGGKIWIKIREELSPMIKTGMTGKKINEFAKTLFDKYSVETAFYNYENFPGHICVSVNDCIIHGVGNEVPFKPQDKVTLDVGFKYKSVFIDSAFTQIVVAASNPPYCTFIEKCKKLLWAGIKAVKPNCTNGDIAFAIESLLNSYNEPKFSLIDGYVGHAIGRQIHLKPRIFNKGMKKGQGDIILPNTVICIEPMMLNQPTGEHRRGKNGFDVLSKVKGVFTCHWEHMVLVTETGIEVLTATEEEIKKYLG